MLRLAANILQKLNNRPEVIFQALDEDMRQVFVLVCEERSRLFWGDIEVFGDRLQEKLQGGGCFAETRVAVHFLTQKLFLVLFVFLDLLLVVSFLLDLVLVVLVPDLLERFLALLR